MTRGIPPVPETIDVENTDPVYSAVADLRTIGDAIVRVTNNTNKNVVVTLQLSISDDPAMAAPYETGEAIDTGDRVISGPITPAPAPTMTLAATAIGYMRVSGAWSYARFELGPAAAPGVGSSATIVWSLKHRGD